jgi:hypothetical protein
MIFWLGNLKGTLCFEVFWVEWKIKLKWMLMICGAIVWIGFIWLRVIGLIMGSCGLSNGYYELHKSLKMAWLADWLLVYQDILCCTKQPSYHTLVQFKLGLQYVSPTFWCILNAFQTPAWTLEIVSGRRIWWEWNVCNVMIMPLIWIIFLNSFEVGNNVTNASAGLIIRLEEGYIHIIIEIICKTWAY